MENLITIVNNEAVLDVNAIDTLINLEERIKKIKAIQDEYKATIKKEMEKYGIINLKANRLSITYIAEQNNLEKFNKFQEENPVLYDKYVTMDGKKSAYITIRIK